jgi:periplasmic divalent cation tolerance protein
MPATAVVVTTSVDSEATALSIAERLVEERLAACVHVTAPVTSLYRWEGRIERATEWVCHIKTARARLAPLVERLRALHPYQVPEILTLDVAGGDPAYLAWVAACVEPA